MEQADNIDKAGKALSTGNKNQAIAIVASGDRKQFVPVQTSKGDEKKKYGW